MEKAAPEPQEAILRLSRQALFQSLAAIGFAVALVAMIVLANALPHADPEVAHYAQLAIVSGLSALVIVLLPSSRSHAVLKVLVAKHLFAHRYDYRIEWLRFTATLGGEGDAPPPLAERAAKAIAEITEAPGALLLLPAIDGGLEPGGGWCWPGADAPARAGPAVLAEHLRATGWIAELDPLREGEPGGDETAFVPDWMIAEPAAWVLTPLIHGERLEGAMLLARPRVGRRLDWEDFDLLKVVGRQVASYLAEARGQAALADAARFDEFNRRFAFIMHDIKNQVSQLALLARNAERHADNPAFRADMIETLNSSADRMNDLLARLAQHHRPRTDEVRPMSLGRIACQVAETARALHPIRLAVDPCLAVFGDPRRLDQALHHLVQNAVEASPPGAGVAIRTERLSDAEGAVVVEDRGHGMDAEFVRTRLFRPFASTKDDGFGIGAYEVRELVRAMGGRLEVDSRVGEGTRIAIVLPLAEFPAVERRAVPRLLAANG